MARTDQATVLGVLLKDYDDLLNPSLSPFINAANVLTNNVVTCATNKGVSISSETLLEVETWLAAHAYCMSDNKYTERKTQMAYGKMGGQVGMNLEFTPYGQMAMSLDPSGCLRSMNKGIQVGVSWLGKLARDRMPYFDLTD